VAVDDAGAEDEAAGAVGVPVCPSAAAEEASGRANMRPAIVAVSWSPPLNGPVDCALASPPAVLVLLLLLLLLLAASCKLSTTNSRFIAARRPR
jgi:hypothetical protein